MSDKIFLDINIVLDMMDKSRKNHKKSLAVLEKTVMQDIQICISEDMLSTIYYISDDKHYTLTFFQKIIQKWEILPFGKDVISNAIDFCTQNGEDLEDALQCFSAKKIGCNIFLTSDKKFANCGISIFDYDKFLEP